MVGGPRVVESHETAADFLLVLPMLVPLGTRNLELEAAISEHGDRERTVAERASRIGEPELHRARRSSARELGMPSLRSIRNLVSNSSMLMR